jgi:hypothetical protein
VSAADGRAESPAETLVRLLLLPDLPGLVPQVRVLDGRRVLARFDLADEELMLAVEADGRRGHAGEVMAAKDRARDATHRTAGLDHRAGHLVRAAPSSARRPSPHPGDGSRPRRPRREAPRVVTHRRASTSRTSRRTDAGGQPSRRKPTFRPTWKA